MPTMDEIQNLADRIVRRHHPERIILFGSFARGEAGPDSDIDLLVLMPYSGHAIRQSAAIRAELTDSPHSIDVLVRTPEEFERRCRMNDWFMRDIRDQGIVLHASGN
jgi:predicted nucleotidyltransferase